MGFQCVPSLFRIPNVPSFTPPGLIWRGKGSDEGFYAFNVGSTWGGNVIVRGTNLCPKLVSSTTHGVTLTVADNGVATLTGQSDTTNQAFGWVDFSLPAGTYIASGGNANYTLRIFNVTDNSTLAIVNSTSANVSFTLSAT